VRPLWLPLLLTLIVRAAHATIQLLSSHIPLPCSLPRRYCGKAGLFSSMEGGTCREDTIQAAFCTNDERISSMSGCDQELGIKREPGLGNLFKP
jgi:hypothetical protein